MADFETITPSDLSEVTTGDNTIVVFDATTEEPKKITVTDNIETRIAANESDITTIESGKLAIADLDDTPADDSETAVTSKWIFDNVGLNPSFLPTGTTIELRQDSTAPTGFLYEDGSAVSRTTYADLFTAIGTVYGVGDGSTTFNLPDSRETVNVGIGTKASGVTAHDTYTIGQFKDDQGQGHYHAMYYFNASLGSSGQAVDYPLSGVNSGPLNDRVQQEITNGNHGTPRIGTTTHGKQMGVKKYIKY